MVSAHFVSPYFPSGRKGRSRKRGMQRGKKYTYRYTKAAGVAIISVPQRRQAGRSTRKRLYWRR